MQLVPQLAVELFETHCPPQLWVAAMAEHRAIVKAIASRDPAAARAAMQRHLNQAYKRFSTGWDAIH